MGTTKALQNASWLHKIPATTLGKYQVFIKYYISTALENKHAFY